MSGLPDIGPLPAQIGEADLRWGASRRMGAARPISGLPEIGSIEWRKSGKPDLRRFETPRIAAKFTQAAPAMARLLSMRPAEC